MVLVTVLAVACTQTEWYTQQKGEGYFDLSKVISVAAEGHHVPQ